MGIGTNDMSTKQNDETQSRWYMVNKDGMVTLCADQADAEQVAKDAQEVWPHMGPHRAVQLSESAGAWFTAADMAKKLIARTQSSGGSFVQRALEEIN